MSTGLTALPGKPVQASLEGYANLDPRHNYGIDVPVNTIMITDLMKIVSDGRGARRQTREMSLQSVLDGGQWFLLSLSTCKVCSTTEGHYSTHFLYRLSHYALGKLIKKTAELSFRNTHVRPVCLWQAMLQAYPFPTDIECRG